MHYCTMLLRYCGVAGDWGKVGLFAASGSVVFKQFQYTLRVDGLSNVWNGLSVMKLTNVLFLHSPLLALSRSNTARHLTCVVSQAKKGLFRYLGTQS